MRPWRLLSHDGAALRSLLCEKGERGNRPGLPFLRSASPDHPRGLEMFVPMQPLPNEIRVGGAPAPTPTGVSGPRYNASTAASPRRHKALEVLPSPPLLPPLPRFSPLRTLVPSPGAFVSFVDSSAPTPEPTEHSAAPRPLPPSSPPALSPAPPHRPDPFSAPSPRPSRTAPVPLPTIRPSPTASLSGGASLAALVAPRALPEALGGSATAIQKKSQWDPNTGTRALHGRGSRVSRPRMLSDGAPRAKGASFPPFSARRRGRPGLEVGSAPRFGADRLFFASFSRTFRLSCSVSRAPEVSS